MSVKSRLANPFWNTEWHNTNTAEPFQNMFPKMMQCLGTAGACSLQHVLLVTSSTSQVDQLDLHAWIFKRSSLGQQCNIKFIALHLLLCCFRIIFNNINYLYFMRQQQRFVSANMFSIYTSSRHWATLGFIWSRLFGCLKSNKSNICSTFHSGFVSFSCLTLHWIEFCATAQSLYQFVCTITCDKSQEQWANSTQRDTYEVWKLLHDHSAVRWTHGFRLLCQEHNGVQGPPSPPDQTLLLFIPEFLLRAVSQKLKI